MTEKKESNNINKNSLMKFLNSHTFYILLIALLVCVSLLSYFTLNKTCHSGDCRISHLSPFIIIENSLKDFNQVPFWNSQTMSGEPFLNMGIPNFYPPVLLMSMFMPAVGVMNFTILIHIFLAGLGMYLLGNYFFKQKIIGLYAAVLYIFVHILTIRDIVYWIIGASYIPLIVLFILKALDSEELKTKIFNTLIASVFLALLFLGGATNHFMYLMLIMLCIFSFYAFKLFRNYNKISLTKLKHFILVGVLFLLLGFSLMAIKILPASQWIEFTNRAGTMSWQEVYGAGHLSFEYAFNILIKGGYAPGTSGTQLGILGLFFCGFAIYSYYKKKKDDKIIFLFASMFFIIFLAAGGFYFFWKFVPGFGKLRAISRVLYIYVFFGCLLAGKGFFEFLLTLKKKFSFDKSMLYYIMIALLAFTIFDTFSYSHLVGGNSIKLFPQNKFEDKNVLIENNQIMNYINNDESLFRIHSVEISGIDNADISAIVIPMKREMVYGAYSPIWYPSFFYNYLGTSRQNPAKMWGILNVKYLTSSQELNISGFDFVRKFEEYDRAVPDHSDGPYLYENNQVLPRASQMNNAVLVLGDVASVEQITYALMLADEFNHKNTILVMAKKQFLEQYPYSELKKFDGIFLGTNSLSQNSGFMVDRLKEDGMKFVPDVLAGENELTQENMNDFFSFDDSAYEELEHKLYSPNKRILDIAGKDGWIFLSEQYNMYGGGWTAKLDGNKIPIHRANGVFSAVYIPENKYEELVFEYNPPLLRLGLNLSVMALILVLVYVGYYLFKNKLH
jgi:hypothetical protein